MHSYISIIATITIDNAYTIYNIIINSILKSTYSAMLTMLTVAHSAGHLDHHTLQYHQSSNKTLLPPRIFHFTHSKHFTNIISKNSNKIHTTGIGWYPKWRNTEKQILTHLSDNSTTFIIAYIELWESLKAANLAVFMMGYEEWKLP